MIDSVAPAAPRLSRPVVVGAGSAGLVVAFLMAPLLPFIVVGVCSWWLCDDLIRNPSRRPGTLGIVSLSVFTFVGVAASLFITVLTVNDDCGADVLGADATTTFDQACADAERWRSFVATALVVVICAAAAFGVRRSNVQQAPVAVAVRTFVVSAVAIGVVIYAVLNL